jgi:hypothetical protein
MGKQRHLGAAAGLCSFAALAACLDHPLKPVEYDTEGVGSGALPLSLNKDVDILFVIDNSGSMAEEQATLARNFERLIAKLEAKDVAANYRIAVTTTDAGHVAYCSDTGPEKGRLQLQSCIGRMAEFQTYDDAGLVDRYDEACASICDHDAIRTVPTLTAMDNEMKERPWIERIGAGTNLADGVTPSAAFECFGPQGIAGCGFESTLESMRLALTRASTTTEASYGFMRPGAILSIVIVTDEEDCSARNGEEFLDVWDPAGDRVFWSEDNADAGLPTSEVCWFAGVECTGGPGQYEECHPVNLGVDGQPTGADASVLYDVAEYVEFLQRIEDHKRTINPDAEVLVSVLGGVPDNYATGGADIEYADGAGDDADFQRRHGIGPGCKTTAGEAVPPVRVRAFAEAFALSDAPEDRNLYSVCADDYSPALEQIADKLILQLRPACMPSCVADTDLLTPGVNPTCTITEEYTDLAGKPMSVPLSPCGGTGDAPEFPPGAEVCYRARTDATKTGSTADDLHETCIEEGWNLQFEVLRTAAGERANGSLVNADCVVSQQPEIDCPDLKS